MNADEIIAEIRAASDPTRLPGMARVGIATDRALGVRVPTIRRVAKRAGRDDAVAFTLWDTGIHEARMVAGLLVDPSALGLGRMRAWAREVDSWDLGDLLAEPFAASPHAERAIVEWSRARHGFTKRLAFAMIARLAVRDRDRPDAAFVARFPAIRSAATDERNEVEEGVSWALRQIGKRDAALYRAAIAEAEAMLEEALASGSRAAKWIARDVLREMALPEHVPRLGSPDGTPATARGSRPRAR